MVKKLNKKIMVMVLSGVIGAMSCMPVLAAEDATVHVHEGECCVAEENVSPFGLARAYACDACGKGTVIVTNIETEIWTTQYYVQCPVLSTALDAIKTRKVYYTEECDACDAYYRYPVNETKQFCDH